MKLRVLWARLEVETGFVEILIEIRCFFILNYIFEVMTWIIYISRTIKNKSSTKDDLKLIII